MICLQVFFAKPQVTYPRRPAALTPTLSDQRLREYSDLSTVHVRAKNKIGPGSPYH